MEFMNTIISLVHNIQCEAGEMVALANTTSQLLMEHAHKEKCRKLEHLGLNLKDGMWCGTIQTEHGVEHVRFVDR